MSAIHTYAAVAFATGLLFLLAWAWATIENPRSSRLFVKSLGFFVLPIALLIALPGWLLAFPFSMWAIVVLEECLKANAARTEQKPGEKFALVVLFGIWELVLSKPMKGLSWQEWPVGWGRWELAGLVAASVVPLLMHTVTAAIYAFHLKGKPWKQLLTCCILHILFNEFAAGFGYSPAWSAVQALVLAFLLCMLWPEPAPGPSAKETPS